MEKLPREIAFEILYRLPPESVVLCKLVCKCWRSFLHLLLSGGDGNNHFANNMHLRRQRNLDYYSTLNVIALHEFRDEEEEEEEGLIVGKFHITEDDQVEDQLNCKVKIINLSQICVGGWKSSRPRLVGSCNGLLCLTKTCGRRTRIGICNPLLNEYVPLPLSDLQLSYHYMVIGFGHSPVSEEYKVVAVYYSLSESDSVSYHRLLDPDIGRVEVYTLGCNKSSSSSSNDATGMWRSKGTIEYRLRSGSRPVLINGSLHWLAKTRGVQNIVSFDLEDEEFRVIPLPSYPHVTNKSIVMSCGELKELGGCLCLIEETGDQVDWLFLPQKDLDIWVLEDYMNKESWVREFSIKGEEDHWFYSPCAIKKKKKNGDGGEILFWCNSQNTKRLVSYDSKTRCFKEVGGRQVVVTGSKVDPVLHINSLVSVKALEKVDAHAENHHKTKT